MKWSTILTLGVGFIGSVGYVVELTHSTGHAFNATNEDTGEPFMVWAADPYRAACELAQAVGVDL